MASEKEIPSPEILQAARDAFNMPKAGGVGLLRKAASYLHVKVAEFPGSSSRLILTAINAMKESK